MCQWETKKKLCYFFFCMSYLSLPLMFVCEWVSFYRFCFSSWNAIFGFYWVKSPVSCRFALNTAGTPRQNSSFFSSFHLSSCCSCFCFASDVNLCDFEKKIPFSLQLQIFDTFFFWLIAENVKKFESFVIKFKLRCFM